MSDKPSLLPDCSKCAALCCVAFAFDKSEMFAIDKANGVPCPNLSEDGLCKIHGSLNSSGFRGCVAYNCNGAGQRVTQEIFNGQSWQSDSSLLVPMLEAFSVLGRVHELLLLLHEAEKLPLSQEKRQSLLEFSRSLNPDEGWTAGSLKAFDVQSVEEEIRIFLMSLRRFV